jgi:nitrite reductase (NADH) large subunit
VTQLYREQGWYLERMYKWCDRVGLDAIRRQVVEDVANRKALFGRFAYSQQFSQSDPWSARAQRGVDRNEFTPLAELERA